MASPATLCMHPCGIIILGPSDPLPPIKGCVLAILPHPSDRSIFIASRVFTFFNTFVGLFAAFRAIQTFAELRVDLQRSCFFLRPLGSFSTVGVVLGMVAALSTFVGLVVMVVLLRSAIISRPFLQFLRFWVFQRMGLMVFQLGLWSAVSLYFIAGEGVERSAVVKDVELNLVPVIALFTIGFPAIDFFCLLKGIPNSTFTVLRVSNIGFLMFALSWRAKSSTFFMGCDTAAPKDVKSVVLLSCFEVLSTSILFRYLTFTVRKFLRPRSPSCDTTPFSPDMLLDPPKQQGVELLVQRE